MAKILILKEGMLLSERPDPIEELNDGKGGFNYNYGIEEVFVEKGSDGNGNEIVTEATDTTEHAYRFSRLVCEAPKSKENIFETLLDEKYPEAVREKLREDYDSERLQADTMSSSAGKSYLQSSDKVAAYKAYLEERESMRIAINSVCD